MLNFYEIILHFICIALHDQKTTQHIDVQLLANHASHTASTPRLRTVFGECAFWFSDSKAWNALPDQFHSIESTDSFKNSSKHFYLVTLFSP